MITLPISLILLHFIGDFILQSDWMALNKSKHLDVLLIHTTIYSLTFFAYGWRFVGITLILHTITDYITSRITSSLWFIEMKPNRSPQGYQYVENWEFLANLRNTRHWFFVIIGLDQVIHYLCLALTLSWIGG